MRPINTNPMTPAPALAATPASAQARFAQGVQQLESSVYKQAQQQWDAHNVYTALVPEMTPARTAPNRTPARGTPANRTPANRTPANRTPARGAPARGKQLTPDHSRALKSWQPNAVNRAPKTHGFDGRPQVCAIALSR